MRFHSKALETKHLVSCFLLSNFTGMRLFLLLFTFVESKETKNSTLECKENDQLLRISDLKNINKRKNRLTPVKLRKQKTR